MKLEKLNKLASNTVLILSLIFSIILVLSNTLFIGKSVLEGNLKEMMLAGIIIALLTVFIYLMLKIKNRKIFIISLFITSFIVRGAWVLLVDTEPVSDFFLMQDAAMKIINGDKASLLDDLYFSSWVYQLGFTTYLVFLNKIFNGSLLAIKFINVFIVSFIPVVIYKIVEKLISERSARIAGYIYSLYFASIAYTSTLTNQHITTLFFYLAIYLILTKFNKRWTFVWAGLLMGLGQIIRPEGSIVLLALLLFIIFKDMRINKEYFINIGKTLGVAIIFFCVINIFSVYLINTGVTRYEFGNRNPLWKFVTGLNYESNGSYSHEDNELLYYVPAGEEKNKMEKEIIKERLSDPKKVAILFAKKTVTFWGANDNSFSFIYTDEDVYNKYNNISVAVEKLQYFIIIMLFAVGVWELYKRRRFENLHLFLIMFLGYIFVYMLIEIQIRYRYFIIPLLLIIAAYGIESIMLRRDK